MGGLLFAVPMIGFCQVSLHVVLLLEKPQPGGTLHVSLFTSKKAYIANKGGPEKVVQVEGSTASCDFENLGTGQYAIKVFQDVNGNGVLDKSWLGWPKEPVGYSNNAPINTGEPPFNLAVVKLETGNSTERIRVR